MLAYLQITMNLSLLSVDGDSLLHSLHQVPRVLVLLVVLIVHCLLTPITNFLNIFLLVALLNLLFAIDLRLSIYLTILISNRHIPT